MSMGSLLGETFIQSELDARRERTMQQYARHPRRHHKRHLHWPFGRSSSRNGLPVRNRRPAVS